MRKFTALYWWSLGWIYTYTFQLIKATCTNLERLLVFERCQWFSLTFKFHFVLFFQIISGLNERVMDIWDKTWVVFTRCLEMGPDIWKENISFSIRIYFSGKQVTWYIYWIVKLVKGSHLGAFCPQAIVYCYLEFKLRYLENLKLFLIRVKELLESIVLRKKKAMGFCSFQKHFLEKAVFE